MRQLVQLKQKEAEFKKLKTELVFVFREEKKQVEGLKAIQAKRKTKFTLLTDFGGRKTRGYSRKKGQFATYVIDKKRILRDVLDGTKPKRPNVDLILKAVRKLEAAKESKPPKKKTG